jgi:SWI/SNF-related matrix-associated actin-dependent regulator of chromatin subfamily A member 5
MEPNPLVYNKFKSKFYPVDLDVFLSEKVLEYGPRKIAKVKDDIKHELMFRFDHYIRTRTEADLNKRLNSIYRLLEKEKELDTYGMNEKPGRTPRKRSEPKESLPKELKNKNNKRVKK